MTTPESILLALFMLSVTVNLLQWIEHYLEYEKDNNKRDKIVIDVEVNTDEAIKSIKRLENKIKEQQIEYEYLKKKTEIQLQQKEAGVV